MKIILFSRQGVVHTAGDLHQMFDAIARFGFDYAVNEEFAPQIERLTGISIDAAHRYGRPMGPQPAESVLVCYGGDGTLLDGIHRLGGAEIPVIVLNSVVNLHKAVSFFSRHRVVHALLDNDDAGQKALARLGESLPSSEVIDQSVFYRDHKYLNEYLQEKQHQQVQRKQQPHGHKVR